MFAGRRVELIQRFETESEEIQDAYLKSRFNAEGELVAKTAVLVIGSVTYRLRFSPDVSDLSMQYQIETFISEKLGDEVVELKALGSFYRFRMTSKVIRGEVLNDFKDLGRLFVDLVFPRPKSSEWSDLEQQSFIQQILHAQNNIDHEKFILRQDYERWRPQDLGFIDRYLLRKPPADLNFSELSPQIIEALNGDEPNLKISITGVPEEDSALQRFAHLIRNHFF